MAEQSARTNVKTTPNNMTMPRDTAFLSASVHKSIRMLSSPFHIAHDITTFILSIFIRNSTLQRIYFKAKPCAEIQFGSICDVKILRLTRLNASRRYNTRYLLQSNEQTEKSERNKQPDRAIVFDHCHCYMCDVCIVLECSRAARILFGKQSICEHIHNAPRDLTYIYMYTIYSRML